ncbi:expansin-like A1 [Benincasa hispida]|uniref:expansin-like A1 n=1 Tax=Benincasa hispida TaxID=102211 RepID=UPI001900617B|nr:expansin-like A1 [Benincasa hispida]
MAWFFTFLLFFLLSSVNACDRCISQSKAAHYYEDAPTSYGGACGYGNLALEMSRGYFAAAVPSLYRQGMGCGACYQVRCKNATLCNTMGTKIVLTDHNSDNRTDFVLSKKAFSAMALNGKGQELLKIGIVDIEYKRIPCEYNKNLLIQVVEWSHKPYYLAIKFLYQGGQTDITAVNLRAQDDSGDWQYMKRNYGAIWDTNKVPEGAIKLVVIVVSGYKNGRGIMINYALPADWKNGEIYDTGIQIKDIATEACNPWRCGEEPWK